MHQFRRSLLMEEDIEAGDSPTNRTDVGVVHYKGIERLCLWCGLVATLVIFVCVTVSTIIASADEFTWEDNALSDLGRPGASTFWLFNCGLTGGGCIGLPFAWPVWKVSYFRMERANVCFFITAMLSLAFIGIFHLPTSPHGWFAFFFFIGVPLTLFIYGRNQRYHGHNRVAAISIILGTGYVLMWATWIPVSITRSSADWFAVTEYLSGTIFGSWLVMVGWVLLKWDADSRRVVCETGTGIHVQHIDTSLMTG